MLRALRFIACPTAPGVWPGSPPVSTTAMSHSTASHVLGRELREPRADAAPLIVGIDADDVDDAHPLMECVQCDGHETDRASVGNGHEDVPFIIRARRI